MTVLHPKYGFCALSPLIQRAACNGWHRWKDLVEMHKGMARNKNLRRTRLAPSTYSWKDLRLNWDWWKSNCSHQLWFPGRPHFLGVWGWRLLVGLCLVLAISTCVIDMPRGKTQFWTRWLHWSPVRLFAPTQEPYVLTPSDPPELDDIFRNKQYITRLRTVGVVGWIGFSINSLRSFHNFNFQMGLPIYTISFSEV